MHMTIFEDLSLDISVLSISTKSLVSSMWASSPIKIDSPLGSYSTRNFLTPGSKEIIRSPSEIKKSC